MKLSSSFRALGVGTLTALAAASAAAIDTSDWKCQTCPFEKGTSGTLDAGIAAVSERSRAYGDYTGLDRRNAVVLGGSLRWRGDDGYYANLLAEGLGLDARSVDAVWGREGVAALTLAWDGLPRLRGDGTATPFTGLGGAVLGLPAGFPAANSGLMPATALQPVDIGFQRNRLDLAGQFAASDAWTVRLAARHDTREGSWVGAGSFFANTSQLVIPVDHRTDQIDVAARYSGERLQFSVGYSASAFRNGNDALTWANPFTPIVSGATRSTLALAPDNQFHQLQLSLGYQATPGIRLSGELAVGRMTQDAAFLPLTSNTSLGAAAVQAASLSGRASTLDAAFRLNAALGRSWRLLASVAHEERNNDTPVAVYPGVATDMFITPPAANQPYSFQRDRARVQLDGRVNGAWAASLGADHDTIERPQQDAPATREARLWGRFTVPLAQLGSWTLKAAHAERKASSYSTVTVAPPAENPLLRRFNMADRRRDTGGVRADLRVGDSVTIGLDADVMLDDYRNSLVGLRDAHVASLGGDVAAAVSDTTSLHAYARGEQTRSRQAGSQGFALPDWKGKVTDRVEIVGLGVRQSALAGRLDLAADLTVERTRSQLVVDPGSATPAYPAARNQRDTLSVSATYKIQDKLSLLAAYAYEHRDTQDWRLDGVLPMTVGNLLALGETAPRYDVHVVRVMLRHRF